MAKITAFYRIVLAASVAAIALAIRVPNAAPAEPADGQAASPRPNLLLILTDDQRFDMMGRMNPTIQTPQMDGLAREGVRFENAFVTTSICAASRASILCGVVERTHQFTFGTPPLAARFTDRSYPALLKAAGYRTGFVGKFGIKVEKGATARMFDFFAPLNRSPYMKKQKDGSLRHLTDIEGDRAVEFLRSVKADQPFCLSVSFNAPHAEDRDPRQYIWPPEVDGLYTDLTVPPPALGEPAFFAAQPKFLQESMNRDRWYWRFDTPEKYQRMVKGYWRMISHVDRVVGRLREELRARGLERNTVIVFTADNGYFLGERGFAGKWLPYDLSLRVPLIVADPRPGRMKASARPTAIALNIDLAPTLLELAGCQPPPSMQGRSLVLLLTGRAPKDWRSDFWCEHLMENPRIIKHEGVRSLRYRYSRYFEQDPVYEELFDLEHDKLETHNLAGEPAYAKLLGTMRHRCDELRDRYGGPYQKPEK